MKYLLFILLFAACKKDQECETWLIQDMCYPKNSSVSCATYSPREAEICGDRLEDARHGRETIRKEDADVKLTTAYIQKIR